MKIITGIITYNPDIERLKENIAAIENQVNKILLIDNNSKNILEIERLVNQTPNVLLLKNEENFGVARALNQQMEYAVAHEFDWVLTLDQDSVVPPNIVETYRLYCENEELGVIACDLDYIGQHNKDRIKRTCKEEYVGACITSGSLTRVEAWERTEHYCEKMFIDEVDIDFCNQIWRCGYKILRINTVRLLHELGKDSRLVNVMGKTIRISNHSPLRNYYIARNMLLRGQRNHCLRSQAKELIRHIVAINKYEHNRLKKNGMILLGIFHFIIGRFGKL